MVSLIDFEYDSFGYTASNNKESINLLLIPNYNLLVVCKNKKYGLVLRGNGYATKDYVYMNNDYTIIYNTTQQ